jgi:hypothetical protein
LPIFYRIFSFLFSGTVDPSVKLQPHDMMEKICKMLESKRDKYDLHASEIVSLAGKGIAVVDMIIRLQSRRKYSGPPVQQLLSRLWKAIILLDESNWLNLAMQQAPEKKAHEIREGIALYHVIVACLQAAESGDMEKTWIINSLNAEQTSLYIEQTGLMRKKVDKDGHLKTTAKDNPLVLRTIQEAISLAFKEAEIC